jgi:hypothetical protein
MATNQTIRKFYDRAITRDFSRDFLFRVAALDMHGIHLGEEELLYVKTANLPGRAITNVPTPYMGLNFNVPGNTTYPGSDNYSLTFYLDKESSLRQQFETASRNLFDDRSSTGVYGTPSPDDSITLWQLDKELNPISQYNLIGASIRNINDVSYNIAAGTGQTVELTVTIAYHFYTEQQIGTNPMDYDLTGTTGFL